MPSSSGDGGRGRGNLGLPKPLGWGLGPHGAFLTGCVRSFGPLRFVTASSPTRTPPFLTILPTSSLPRLRAMLTQTAQNFKNTEPGQRHPSGPSLDPTEQG